MEIRKRFDLRMVVAVAYFVAFAIYLAVGLVPVEATNYEISAELSIPTIGLSTGVTQLKLHDLQLNTPKEIVGSFARNDSNILLIGHSSSVFRNLELVQVGDTIIYDDDTYTVRATRIVAKDDIDMNVLLTAQDKKTLTLMTCTGDELSNGDSTKRFILIAT